MLLFNNDMDRFSEIEKFAQTIIRVNEKLSLTLKKINKFVAESLGVEKEENIGLLKYYKISPNVLKQELNEYRNEGFVSDKLKMMLCKARLMKSEVGCFSERLGLVNIIEEDWNDELVPYVLEVLWIIGGYTRESGMRKLLAMYVVDNTLLQHSCESQRLKYALISVAMEYFGGVTAFLNNGILHIENNIEEIALKTRNRFEKKYDDNMPKSEFSDEHSEELEIEEKLFDKYYNQLIEPIVFDASSFGKKYLLPDIENYDIDETIERLQISDDLNMDVVKFVIEDARTALKNREKYNPFWIWGSDRYIDIIRRINKKDIELAKKDEDTKHKLRELICLLAKDTDDRDFESMMQFGAKLTLMYDRFVLAEDYDYVTEYCQDRKIDINAILMEYQDYGNAFRDAVYLEQHGHTFSMDALYSINNWKILLKELNDFERHGPKTERKNKSFYNKAKHCFHSTV